MTTRDPPSRNYLATTGADGRRELTESLDLEPLAAAPLAGLAVGTHNRESTRVESPNGRARTVPPTPAAPVGPEHEHLGKVLGAYRLLELLGKGGMGYVYRAEHTKLGREVALKLLRRDYASRRDAVARFFQEARTVNRVRHRNIVEVTDFVELDDGTTYIIMELLTGASLGAWARSGVDLPRALAVLVQICDGLSAAHQVGVVHRDLKPDNVIVVPTSDGAELVKLLDFGVAKLLNRDDEAVGLETAAGSVIGTPAYMSPEQAGGMEIDGRSDIYSLGAIMYELFCGTPVFRGRSFGDYVRKHLTELPVPPRQTPGGADLDADLEALILRCLDKDPTQRFPNVVELRDALIRLLGGGGPRFDPIHSGLYAGVGSSGLRAQLPQASDDPDRFRSSRSGPHEHPGPAMFPSGPAVPAGAPVAPQPTGTSWTRWVIGGTIAVSIGLAGAMLYSRLGRAAPSPAPVATTPAAAPPVIAAPPPAPAAVEPVPHPTAVELRFDATPPGGVFVAGKPGELCRTPCALNVDLADGGPTDRRDFVVRRDGYVDSTLTVDLVGGPREFRLELAPLVAAQAEPPAAPDPTPEPRRPTRRKAKPARDPAPRTARKPARDPAPTPDPTPPAAAAEPTPEPTRRADDKPAPRKPASIDPADTLDPFRPK